MSKRIAGLTALSLMVAASGYVMPEDLLGPTKPPKSEPGPDDFERMAKAEAKRQRKLLRNKQRAPHES